MALLDIRNLTIEIDTPNGRVKAVDRMSLILNDSEIRGLVGESGSGKSLVAKAIIGLTKDSWHVSADRMRLDDVDLLQLTPRKRRKLIAKEVAVIFQDAASCLDPAVEIGRQFKELIPGYVFSGKWWQLFRWRYKLMKSLLHKVGIKDHRKVLRSYPYELTDGECQKIMIAMAMASKPKLLIADEPTNELDSITKTQIWRLLDRMNQNNKITLLLIEPDLSIVTQIADHITVMYCGQSIESAPTDKILQEPKHPYTDALLHSIPKFNNEWVAHKSPLPSLKGAIPPLQHLPIGCRLGPRCPNAQNKCVKMPLETRIKQHKFNCHFPLNMEDEK